MQANQRSRSGRLPGPLAAAALAAVIGCASAPEPDPAPSPEPDPVSPALAEAVFDSAWSMVYRTYYDTTFAGVDWLALREELRPVARNAGTTDSLRSVLDGMLDRLGDSHFGIIPAEVADALEPDSLEGAAGEPGDVGVELRVVDGALTVVRVRPGSVAERAGVRPGWVLDAIDGHATADLLEVVEQLEENRRLAQARVEWAAERRLAGSVGDTVVARMTDGRGRETEARMVAEAIPGTPVRFGNLPTMFADLRYEEVPLAGGCAGVIAFDVWMTPILPRLQEAFEALRHCDGIVLDLRGNPGGVAGMVMGVSGYFMDERRPLGRLITRDNELSLVSMPRRVTASGETMTPYGGPLALLVDGQSMSTSEIFAGGLQEVGRARVFGQTSGGQALPALMARLPNEDVLMHVFANLVTPEGVRLEGRGVIPDREVSLDRQELLEGRDVPLEAALEWIRSETRT
jgi:carboxyl-terminal processing protease